MSEADLIVIVVACLVGSLMKAITGMGFPVIAIPIISLFVSLEDAVTVVALPNLLSNGVLAFRERSHFEGTRDLPVLAIFGVGGAVLGTIAFVSLPDEPMVIALIVLVVAYIALYFLRPDQAMSAGTSRRWAPLAGGLGGLFQGGIGISGPVVGSWVHAYRLERSAHVLSVTSLFFITGLTQLAILTIDGQLEGRLTAIAIAVVPTLGMIPIGTRLRERLSVRGFDLAILAILAASAIALAIRTFA